MQRWNIAITGFGAIGRMVAQLLHARRADYAQRYGADVRVTAVCTSRAGLFMPDGLPAPQELATTTLQAGSTGVAFIEQTNAHVLIDAGPTDYETGGIAYAYLRSALARGVHAIAISKGALIFDLAGLRALAAAHRVSLKFSGATAAALPTVDLIEHNLAGCRVVHVEGIFTATSNYVLGQMMDGVAFEDAVAQAQHLGIAEPDPRFDLAGWDTACKITLIANAALAANITLSQVARAGIERISHTDIDTWKAAGVVPKLVGEIVRGPQGIQANVALRTYAHDHPFAQIHAGMKAISVKTDEIGEVLAICRASPMATAAAALKDFEHILLKR